MIGRSVGALALLLPALSGCRSMPPSLPEVRSELRAWVASGDYEKELEAALRPARRHLERRASDVERPALVLDVDETSLSTWAYQRDRDFCYTPQTFDAWIEETTPPPIEATLALYRQARQRGVAVFFVTGRLETLRDDTERSLRAAGYEAWEELVLRPSSHHGPVADYKGATRRRIEERGYTILLNVGDQRSDLWGGHAERAVLLPNPFYTVE